jgi:hypothetical protein
LRTHHPPELPLATLEDSSGCERGFAPSPCFALIIAAAGCPISHHICSCLWHDADHGAAAARYRGVRRAMMAHQGHSPPACNEHRHAHRPQRVRDALRTQSPALRHTASPSGCCFCASAVASHYQPGLSSKSQLRFQRPGCQAPHTMRARSLAGAGAAISMRVFCVHHTARGYLGANPSIAHRSHRRLQEEEADCLLHSGHVPLSRSTMPLSFTAHDANSASCQLAIALPATETRVLRDPSRADE